MARNMDKENHWREVIARWQVSGLSMAGFCKQEGLPDKKFFWWKRQIAKRDGAAVFGKKVKFVPMRIKDKTDDLTTSSHGAIELVSPGGFVIRVSAGFDKVTLLSLLELVGKRKC